MNEELENAILGAVLSSLLEEATESFKSGASVDDIELPNQSFIVNADEYTVVASTRELAEAYRDAIQDVLPTEVTIKRVPSVSSEREVLGTSQACKLTQALLG